MGTNNDDRKGPSDPPHGGPTTPVGDPPSSMESAALAIAVHDYLIVNKLGAPMDAAAFGWACSGLMQALNINLNVAALLLRVELERRGL